MKTNTNLKKCPLCNQENLCARTDFRGSGLEQKCWCSDIKFPEKIFDSLSKKEKGKVCICKKCLLEFIGKDEGSV